MSNVLAEDKRQQVLALGRLGWSLRQIERTTGVRRETASGYLKAAGVAVRGRGRPSIRPAKPAISSAVSTDSAAVLSAPAGTGEAATVSDDHPNRAPRASAQVWAELHERAFRRLGGSVRVVVLDNLKEGVLTPDIYDPTLNPLYRDVLAHYGAVALPCRVGDPDRKGKVEAGVGHAQKTPLRGQRFERLDEAQTYLDRWERRWADTRIHPATKRQVAAMFAEERPALGPLPLEPFRYYQYGHRTVQSRRLRRGRRGLLQRAARLGRSAHPRPMERGPRPAARPPPPASSSASTCARRAAGIALPIKTGPPGHRPRPSPCSPPPSGPVPPSLRSVTTSTATTAPPASAAFSASSRSPGSTVPPSPKRPPPPRLNSACPPTVKRRPVLRTKATPSLTQFLVQTWTRAGCIDGGSLPLA